MEITWRIKTRNANNAVSDARERRKAMQEGHKGETKGEEGTNGRRNVPGVSEREREKERERDERFRDNRQDVRRVTIANHNGDRKTRMTG